MLICLVKPSYIVLSLRLPINWRRFRHLRPIGYRLRSSLGQLPDFIIIGTMKSGTTSMYEYLIQHPSVMPATQKEIHFFDNWHERGLNWYKLQFSPLSTKYFRELTRFRKQVTGESSPTYLFYPEIPKRMSEVLPHAKIIVMLRNPVDRAYSHYHHVVRHGFETLSFNEAIDTETKRLQAAAEIAKVDKLSALRMSNQYSYLERGKYADQLTRWFSYFPRDNFLIIGSEDFFGNPVPSFFEVLDFLGLKKTTIPKVRRWNEGMYSPMSEDVRSHLVQFFKPYNERLYKLLGRNFDWDK